jgi:HEAT repeat protein
LSCKGADKAIAIVPTAIPDLIEARNDSDMAVRLNAATALGLFGPAASSAIPALTAAAEDKKRDMRASAE